MWSCEVPKIISPAILISSVVVNCSAVIVPRDVMFSLVSISPLALIIPLAVMCPLTFKPPSLIVALTLLPLVLNKIGSESEVLI